jgi:F-type H+-transporting ATPase subunit b
MLFATLLLQQAEEGPPPLIDIDGTVVIQWLLFVFLVAVLYPLLWKPFLRVRDERRKNIEGAQADARAMAASADKMRTDIETRMHQAKLRGADERARLRVEAAAREREILAAARQQAHTSMEEQRTHMRGQVASARQTLEGQAGALARQLAKKIIGREVTS